MITQRALERAVRRAQRDAVVQRSRDRLHDLAVRIFVDETMIHFTVAALVRFYSSSEGRSVLLKITSFTRDLERELGAAINTEIGGSVPPASSS